MADVAGAITEAPKKALAFSKNNILAFAVLAILVMLAFVAIENRKPGAISSKLVKIPVLGKWAYTKPTTSTSVS